MFRSLPMVLSCLQLLLLIATPARSVAGEETDITLYLVGASDGPTPIIIKARGGGGKPDPFAVIAPFGPPGSNFKLNAKGAMSYLYPAEAKIGNWSDSAKSLSASVTGTFPQVQNGEFKVSVSAKIEDGRITGEWKGKGTTGREGGMVIGWRRPARKLTDGVPVSLVLEGPRSNWDGRDDLHVGFVIRGRDATDPCVTGNPVGSAFNTVKYKKPVVASVGNDGRPVPIITSGSYALKEMKESKVSGDSVELQFQAEGDVSGTYTLTARVVGDCLIGEGSVEDKTLPLIGQIGLATPPALPAVKGKSPEDRILAALLWAYTSPEMGGIWANDANAASAVATGDKQYDNFFENAYGGMVPMSLLARLASDPDLAHEARLRALRAGWALHARGACHDGLAIYYKGMVWLSAWGPMGYMDLYELTGDRIWLERPLQYARMLKRIQMESGTWTFYDESNGKVGKSNARHDRSMDNIPLHCGEYLLFLGRLRTEAGVNDFKDVEQRAADWMLGQFRADPAKLFTDRRPSTRREACGAVWLMQYLSLYGDEEKKKAAKDVTTYIEKNFMDGTYGEYHEIPGFKPAVIDYYPRWFPGDQPAPSTSATSGLALAFKAMGEKKKGMALAESVLSRQTKEGLLDHIGRMTLPLDNDQRINSGGPDQHQMSVKRAETLYNLARFYGLLSRGK